jgi:Cu+-exporting ATPase
MSTDAVLTGTDAELDISGMTCAACAARIERRLNRTDGVSATVNYATERARVRFDPQMIDIAAVIAAVERTGYGARLSDSDNDAAADARLADLRRRLVVAVIGGIPVLVLSMVPSTQFDGWQWVALVLATPVTLWSAWPFHRAMAANLRHRQATMDTLVSVGVSAAWAWSLWALVATPAGDIGMTMSMSFDIAADEGHHIYLEVASTVVAFILAGRYFEARAKRRAGDALRSLMDLGAAEVTRIRADGSSERVGVDLLEVDDVFIVAPGEKVATDGVVIDGVSAVDMSLLTGESMPVDVRGGDVVVGAAVNTTGVLRVRATGVGADTRLAQMARLVADAQSGKAPVQRLADQVSAVFVPVVIVLAIVTVVVWAVVTGSWERSFTAGVAVLIIACPCALGLATPTALLVGTGRGAQMGILIKGPEVLESTRSIDTVVLDKTGTITTGVMTVVAVEMRPSSLSPSVADVVMWAAAVEAHSLHPVARAVVDAHRATGATELAATDVVDHPGVGVSGVVDGRRIEVRRSAADSWAEAAPASTLAEVVVDDEVVGLIAVADAVKDTAKSTVGRLASMGLSTVLLTGDRAEVANAVAQQVGITTVHADVMPDDKLAVVTALQAEGHRVAMVGDGVNDAVALAAADLGIAMGTGTDVAKHASDLTLVRSDPLAVADAIDLSRRTLSTIRVNLFWAFAYNVGAIPLAMTGRLSPMVAGAAMAFSSVFVVSNSLRLRRRRISTTQ